MCVVGLPDDYSGELPLAFVTPSTAAAERMKMDPAEADRIRTSITKVSQPYLPAAKGSPALSTACRGPQGQL